MDQSTSLTKHINATPEKVWAVISDIPGSAKTLSGIDSVQMLTDGPYGAGTRWKETRTMMGRKETVEMWVFEAEPPLATTVKAVQGGADYTTRFTLAARGSGTELTVYFGAEIIKPNILTKVMVALLGRIGMNATRKALAKDLDEIAAKAESL